MLDFKQVRCIRAVALMLVVAVMASITFARQERRKQPALDSANSEQSTAQDKAEHNRQLRQRAFYIAVALADSKDMADNIEAAHMRADFASLFCACGEQDRANQVYRKSINDVALRLFEKDLEKQDRTRLSDLIGAIAQSATRCDSSIRAMIAYDLARLRPYEKEKNENEVEPDIVPDELWGTEPSARRQVLADIMTRAAHDSLDVKKFDEAEKLLEQSLSSCVTPSFMTALTRLQRVRPGAANRLYLKAARRVQALPSGAEVASLDFGLSSRLNAMPYNEQKQALYSDDQAQISIIGAYLDSITAMIKSAQSLTVGQSPDVIRLVKDTLPAYSRLRTAVRPQVEAWLAEAIKRLPPREQAIVQRFSFAPDSPAAFTARLEEIAAKAVDVKERDQAFASLCSTYSDEARFNQAFEMADKITDVAFKQQMIDETTYRQIPFLLNQTKDAQSMQRLIERISSTPIRVKSFIKLAKFAARRNQVLANEALQESVRAVTKLSFSSTRSHLLFRIASAYSEFDPRRASEVLALAVESVGKHRVQPRGRWGQVISATTTVQYDQSLTFSRTLVEDPEQYNNPYDLSAFTNLARVDFDGTMLLADLIEDKAVRASAKYEICAAILLDGEKPQPAESAAPPPND